MTEIAPPDAAPDTDVARLTEALIACPSVTPASGLVFDCLAEMLVPLGFAVHRFIGGGAPDGPVENLFAIRQGPAGSDHVVGRGSKGRAACRRRYRRHHRGHGG